jgi:hypothetical protein
MKMHVRSGVKVPLILKLKQQVDKSNPAALPLGKEPEGEGYVDPGLDVDVCPRQNGQARYEPVVRYFTDCLLAIRTDSGTVIN